MKLKKLLSLLLAAAMVLSLGACGEETGATVESVRETAQTPQETAAAPEKTPEIADASFQEELSSAAELPEEPEGPVITGVTVRKADEKYVDSALYSQYESVTFSDGTTREIDVDKETFVLLRDGAVVDLCDPENWVSSAELYVVEKGQFEEPGMAMNTAAFGPFYFTGAVDLDGGKYMENRSIPGAVTGAEVTDKGVSGGEINVNADYVSSIFAYSENEDHYDVSDVTIRSAGLGANDFGSKGGWGTVVSVGGSAQVDITGSKVFTQGPLHDGIWAGGTSQVNVKDSVVFAEEKGEDFGFEPYAYDRFYITTALLSDEEIQELGRKV